MQVFIIACTDLKPDGTRRHMMAECAFDDLDALTAELRGGPVAVTQIFADKVGRTDSYEIKGRRPITITAAYVHHAFVAPGKFTWRGDSA